MKVPSRSGTVARAPAVPSGSRSQWKARRHLGRQVGVGQVDEDQLAEVVDAQVDVVDAGPRQRADDVLEHRPVADRHERLRDDGGVGAQPRAQPAGQDRPLSSWARSRQAALRALARSQTAQPHFPPFCGSCAKGVSAHTRTYGPRTARGRFLGRSERESNRIEPAAGLMDSVAGLPAGQTGCPQRPAASLAARSTRGSAGGRDAGACGGSQQRPPQPEELQPMRAPRRLIVTIAAGALAVAGGSTLADAHDGPGQDGAGEHHGKRHGQRRPRPAQRQRGPALGAVRQQDDRARRADALRRQPRRRGLGHQRQEQGEGQPRRPRPRADRGPRLRRGPQRRQEHACPNLRPPSTAAGPRSARRSPSRSRPRATPRSTRRWPRGPRARAWPRRADQPGAGGRRGDGHLHRGERRVGGRPGRPGGGGGRSGRHGAGRLGRRASGRGGCPRRRRPPRERRHARAWPSAGPAPRATRRAP